MFVLQTARGVVGTAMIDGATLLPVPEPPRPGSLRPQRRTCLRVRTPGLGVFHSWSGQPQIAIAGFDRGTVHYGGVSPSGLLVWWFSGKMCSPAWLMGEGDKRLEVPNFLLFRQNWRQYWLDGVFHTLQPNIGT